MARPFAEQETIILFAGGAAVAGGAAGQTGGARGR